MKPLGVVYIVVFKEKQVGSRNIGAIRTLEARKRHGGAPKEGRRATGPLSQPVDPLGPTSSHFVHLKISEAWPLTLTFLESRSSCNVKNAKKGVLCQTKLEPDERGLFRKIPYNIIKHGNNII
jgi:hypothetical protein